MCTIEIRIHSNKSNQLFMDGLQKGSIDSTYLNILFHHTEDPEYFSRRFPINAEHFNPKEKRKQIHCANAHHIYTRISIHASRSYMWQQVRKCRAIYAVFCCGDLLNIHIYVYIYIYHPLHLYLGDNCVGSRA